MCHDAKGQLEGVVIGVTLIFKQSHTHIRTQTPIEIFMKNQRRAKLRSKCQESLEAFRACKKETKVETGFETSIIEVISTEPTSKKYKVGTEAEMSDVGVISMETSSKKTQIEVELVLPHYY